MPCHFTTGKDPQSEFLNINFYIFFSAQQLEDQVDSTHNGAPTFSNIGSACISSTWLVKIYYESGVFIRSRDVTAMGSHKSATVSHKRMLLMNTWTFYLPGFNFYVCI
jgi:hypothetical protein